jgi:tRNA (guanosine-2'-O-)-methyltransferase
MSRQLDGTGLKRLHRDWRRRSTAKLALVLDGVQGPFNVGAIVRTAAAYRVEHIWLAGVTPSLRAANVQKTALGTDRYVTSSTVDKAVQAIEAARVAGYQVVAVELTDDAVPLHDVTPTAATCLVVGHEDHGVSAATLDACDGAVYLPLLGRIGSLNVATATGIACAEWARQQWTRSGEVSP